MGEGSGLLVLVREGGLAFRTYGGETWLVIYRTLHVGWEVALLYVGGSRPRPPRNSRRWRRDRVPVCCRLGLGRCSASILWVIQHRQEHKFRGPGQHRLPSLPFSEVLYLGL